MQDCNECNEVVTPASFAREESVAAAVIAKGATANGYALVLDRSKLSVNELAEWVSFESRCCPFLDFQISFAGDGGPLTLQLTGKRSEVKEFLAGEIRAFEAK